MRNFLFLTMISFFIVTSVIAEVPTSINYQGILTDNLGNPVADAPYSVVFTIYDAPTSGNSKWSEGQTILTSSGLFTVLLGSTIPIPDSVFNGNTRYLAIEISGDPELFPRTALVSVPYSKVAGRLRGDIVTDEGRMRITAVGVGGDTTYVESVIPELQGIVVLCNHANGDSALYEQYVQADSASTSLRMNKADLISEISNGASQTREHILLGRQVGLPGATTTSEIELLTDNSHAHSNLKFSNGTDSSEVTSSANESSAVSTLRTVVSTESLFLVKLETDTLGTSLSMFIDGDTASTNTSTADKRKQSLYFPESFHEAIEMLVETSNAEIRMYSINVASGLQDTNVLIENNGNMTLAGNMEVGGSSGMQASSQSFTVPRITTSQRDALVPVGGMIVYNTTTSQFNFFEGSAWVTK